MSDWQRVRELFERVVSLDDDQRERVLSQADPGNAGLRRQVEALLAADAAPRPELDLTAADLLSSLRAELPPDDLCGTSFGAYGIEAHVASGGMAHVYRATRTSVGTQRRVAIKVLRQELDTTTLLDRFQRERQTLAQLEHEHVVAFLDAGTLPDGRPFLVMEYVDGVPLTAWARTVSLRERLQLFVRILTTVQYAHSQLIVHRDLKPSNILVTAQGAPKLLDFGVATVLGSAAGAGHEPGPLTPVYASPEQLAGGPVSTASDVYSLGVLLRETCAGRLDGAAPAGDLARIVQCACAADPAQRYGSAFEFADDLRRFLARQPIAAGRTPLAHRGRLFVGRNRWPLVLVGAVLVALVVGWIAADLERRSARHEASVGWGAHSQAKVVVGLLDHWITSSARVAPELGERAAADLEVALRERLDALPEAETLVRLTLARLYLDRGERERARKHAERAWQLAQMTRGVGADERERAHELLQRIRSDD
jgi:serine/threonine-protein kinase